MKPKILCIFSAWLMGFSMNVCNFLWSVRAQRGQKATLMQLENYSAKSSVLITFPCYPADMFAHTLPLFKALKKKTLPSPAHARFIGKEIPSSSYLCSICLLVGPLPEIINVCIKNFVLEIAPMGLECFRYALGRKSSAYIWVKSSSQPTGVTAHILSSWQILMQITSAAAELVNSIPSTDSEPSSSKNTGQAVVSLSMQEC